MDILQNKIITTRKPHKCWGCAEEFPSGSKLRKYVAVDNGEFQASYYCPDCDERVTEIDDYVLQEGFAMGEIKQYHDDYHGGLK